MGFFKPSASTTSNKAAARLHGLIWVLIYGGLLTLVLGLNLLADGLREESLKD